MHGGRGAAGIVVDGDQAAAVVEIGVVAGHIMEQVGITIVVAADRRRLRGQDDVAQRIVLVEVVPLRAAAGVLVDEQHHLAGLVGVDDVLIAVGQRLHRLHRPTVHAGRIATGRVAIGEGALSGIGAVGSAGAGGNLFGDAVGGIVLEVVVGIGGHRRIAQRGEAGAQGRGQPIVGRGAEDVLQVMHGSRPIRPYSSGNR